VERQLTEWRWAMPDSADLQQKSVTTTTYIKRSQNSRDDHAQLPTHMCTFDLLRTFWHKWYPSGSFKNVMKEMTSAEQSAIPHARVSRAGLTTFQWKQTDQNPRRKNTDTASLLRELLKLTSLFQQHLFTAGMLQQTTRNPMTEQILCKTNTNRHVATLMVAT